MALRLPDLESRDHRWWTLGAMCFALFMVMLDNTVVNVALPSIQRDLDVSTSNLEWTVNAYTLSFAVLLVTGGRMGDIFGRRRWFLVGVVIFGAASLFIAFSQSAAWLVAGRAAQGVGAAFMMPATLSIITNAFEPHERGKAIGTWAGVSAVALAIGPVLGGFLVEHVSWQSIFLINVPVAVAAVGVTLWSTRESRDPTAERTVDVAGVLTLSVGMGSLVLGLVEGNAWGWDSPRIVGLFALAIVSMTAFALIERRVRAPMLDFRHFRSRSFLGANLVAFIVSFSMLAVFFFIALYMQNVRGYGPLEAGIRFLPSTLVIMVVGPIAGRLADRIGPRPLMSLGLVFCSVSMLSQSFLSADTPYSTLALAFVLIGVGMGLVMSPMSTAAMNAVDQDKAGAASGMLSMSRMVGGTFGVAVIGALVTTLGHDRLSELLPGAAGTRLDQLVDALATGGMGIPGPEGVAVQTAFLDAVNASMKLGAAFALVGAVIAWLLIDAVPPRERALQAERERAAEPAPQPLHA